MDNWIKREQWIPRVEKIMTVLRDSESTRDLYPLFGWDGALKRNRELLDGMVHTSSFGNILLNCRDVATVDMEKHLNHISTLLRSFFTIHLGFVFHLNSHYMMASDYVEYQEVGETPPVVAVKLGDGWRMPTKGEQDELRAYCTWKWTTRNGVPVCEVTSTINEATLFFPAAGAKVGFGGPGSSFSSWSSTLSTGHSRFASVLCGDHTSFTEGGAYRCHGHTVRPVKEGKK